jgi:glycerol uptake facilitator-like aquaporin
MKINYPAVIVAAIIHFMIGGLWYGLIFGNIFLRIIEWTPEQLAQVQAQSHWSQYLMAFVTSFVLTYILAHFVQYTKSTNVLDGMQTGFWLWLGFVATTQLPTVIFEQRKLGLYLLNVGYQLVTCLICGAILAVWKPRVAVDAVAETG